MASTEQEECGGFNCSRLCFLDPLIWLDKPALRRVHPALKPISTSATSVRSVRLALARTRVGLTARLPRQAFRKHLQGEIGRALHVEERRDSCLLQKTWGFPCLREPDAGLLCNGGQSVEK